MFRFALPVALLATQVLAQTFTSCNPRNSTCPSDPALGTTFDMTFNESMTEFDPRFFNVTAGTDLISFSEQGAELTISEEGQSVTVVTAFYIFWGSVELIFQAASGQGIISTFNLLSDDLDEIDVEIKGANTSSVTNNYYGWGNTSQLNGAFEDTTMWNDGAMGGMHNYTVVWNQEAVEWYLDNNLVRTAPAAAPGLWPQTPCFLKFGIWAGGGAGEPKGTVAWAGGPTDFNKGPFTMTVQSLKMIDGTNNASTYTYSDRSGSWQSINVEQGESTAMKSLDKESAAQRIHAQWAGLSTGAKIGIAVGAGSVLLIALIIFTFYCTKQRRQGKREKAIADKAWDDQHAELLSYRNRMAKGEFAIHHLSTKPGEKF